LIRRGRPTSAQNAAPSNRLRGSIVYSKPGTPRDKVVVIGKEELNLRTTPQVKINCPKCGNGTAYWWMVQTRGVDESMTQFYRCTKCGYTWREYG
jgi:DNA-directed RNA polymerase subunit M